MFDISSNCMMVTVVIELIDCGVPGAQRNFKLFPGASAEEQQRGSAHLKGHEGDATKDRKGRKGRR